MIPRLTKTRARRNWLLGYVFWVTGSNTRWRRYTLLDLVYLGVGVCSWYWPAVKFLLWRYF